MISVITYRFPYGVIGRLAGRQQRGERIVISVDTESVTAMIIATIPAPSAALMSDKL
jgi:hypothetical protein